VRAWFDDLIKPNDAVSMTHMLPEQINELAEDSRLEPEFDFVVCCLERAPTDSHSLLKRLSAMLKPSGIILLAMGGAFREVEGTMSSVLRSSSHLVLPEGLLKDRAIAVGVGAWGDLVQTAMMRSARASVQAGLRVPVYWLMLAAGLALASVVFNIAAISRREPVGDGEVSSLLFKFHKAMPVFGEEGRLVCAVGAQQARQIAWMSP
jgi:hypothetical protein